MWTMPASEPSARAIAFVMPFVNIPEDKPYEVSLATRNASISFFMDTIEATGSVDIFSPMHQYVMTTG